MKTNVVKGFLFLVALLSMVVGCQDKDYYDETNNRPSQSDLFPDGVVIAEDFNWSTTKTVELSVSVDDKYNGAYHYIVEVYDVNPLYDSEAKLLGAGVAKTGKDFVSKIVAPVSTDVLYVQQTDPAGEKRVTSVKFDNETVLSVSFKAVSQSSDFVKSKLAKTTRAGSVSVPATTPGAIDMTSSAFNGISSGRSYVIPKGKEYRGAPSVDWTLGGSIFVEGTWIIPSDLNVIYYTVVVQQGGTVKFENENSTFTLGGQLIIASGATFAKGNVSMLFYGGNPNRKAVTNYGMFKTKTFTIDGGCELNNYGDVVAEDIKARNSSNTLILNEGSLTANNLTFEGSGASVVNNCLLVVSNKLTLRGTKLDIGEGCLVSVSALDAESSTINLFSKAMLVANTVRFGGGMTNVYGLGTEFALAQFNTINYQNWNVFKGRKNLAVYAQNIVTNGTGGNGVEDPAYFVKSNMAAPNISATSCNGNGNPVVPGQPIERKLPTPQLATYTYAFEDNWPSYGDYDMNDFVTDVTLIRDQNSDNKLTKLTIKANLRAIGALKHLGAAIQLDNVPAGDVKSVTYSNSSLIGQTFVLNSSGVETGQTYAVIPLSDDIHRAFGLTTPSFVNTTGTLKYSPVELTMTVEFKSPIRLLTNDDLNVFIVTAGYKNTRTEVHLSGRQPSDKVNRSQFISANLRSTGDMYRSHENLIWGLCIADVFEYPIESEKITDVFPLFKGWAESKGTQDLEWYKKSK